MHPRLAALAQRLGQRGFAVEPAESEAEVLVTEPETGVRVTVTCPPNGHSGTSVVS